MTMIRTYSDLILLDSFLERYDYLKLSGEAGFGTFGYNRYINQAFYKSKEWKRLRNEIISRDFGCDLGIPGMEVGGIILVHHMNPVSLDQLEGRDEIILEPEHLITVSANTHQAIHYSDSKLLSTGPAIRRAGDTTLW